jgi:uncharacterized membrane protein YhaH (DUF805 family)
MDFMTAIRSGLANYVKFDGRASRSEYWWWVLFYVIVYIAATIITSVLGSVIGSTGAVIGSLILMVVALGLLLPTLGLTIRRLHDTDRSGWWILLGFVPLIGLILIVFYCLPGTEGDNQFGRNPLAPAY